MKHRYETLVAKWKAWVALSGKPRTREWLEYCDVRDGLPIGTYWERLSREKKDEPGDSTTTTLM